MKGWYDEILISVLCKQTIRLQTVEANFAYLEGNPFISVSIKRHPLTPFSNFERAWLEEIVFMISSSRLGA